VGNKRNADGDSSLLRPLPHRNTEQRSEAPSLLGAAGSLFVLDLLMRHRVYVGIQVSSDGGVLGFTILDGKKRERAWLHTDGELAEFLREIEQRYT
jgi:hypothetical protein